MRRVFIIRNLRRCGCPPELMLRAYYAFMRQILLYAYPCVCNAPAYLKQMLTRVENRVSRIIGSKIQPCLLQAADASCVRLMDDVSLHAQHPLRALFLSNNSCRTRSSCELRKPFAHTARFGASFIKFAS